LLYIFLRWCPGALGLFLRQKLYPRYVKECGQNVLFGRFVDLDNGKDAISIGSGVVLNDFVSLQGSSEKNASSTLVIGDNVFIGTESTVKVTGGNIMIGSGSNIGSGCIIQSDSPVLMEQYVLLAAFCKVGLMNHKKSQLLIAQNSEGHEVIKETIIESGCWLGVRAKVEAGHHIGDGTIVGAHCNVTADLPDHVIAIGDPVEILRKRV